VSPSFQIVTLFPEMLEGYLGTSILGRARDRGLFSVGTVNPRDYTTDAHRTVDDAPYGGGAGMVMMAEPIAQAIEAARAERPGTRVILLSPAGRRFDQDVAAELAAHRDLTFVCGRYEGIDERVAEHLVDEELSIGDYVLTGGELGALVVIDAVSRLREGVLGNPDGSAEESFTDGPLLEHPHYTRPRVWRGHAVPDVLLGGNHAAIRAWREEQRLQRTRERRPERYEIATKTKKPLE